MRGRELVLLVALTVLIYGSFSPADARDAALLDDHAHVLEFFKSVPDQLNYQGFLANAADSAAITATPEMTFRLFDSQTKGAELWSETHPAVEVQGGLFQVLLGSVIPFPDGLFEGFDLWLQTEVGPDVLTPRKPLVSVAYSRKAANADEAATAGMASNAGHLEGYTVVDLDDRWVNEDDLDHLNAADGTPANAVHVDDAGKVGIGTTSPLTELDVSGSVNATTYYGDGSNLTGISGGADTDWTIRGDTVYHETGPVGIGTASPTAPLTIQAGSGDEIYFPSAGNNVDIKSVMSINLGTNSGHGVGLITNNLHRVLVNGSGDVGIGTISPAYKLDVNGDVNATTYYGDGSNLTGISGSADADWTISGSDMYSAVSGNVGIGTTSPATKLHLASTGDTEFRMTHDDVKNSISFYQSASKTGFLDKDDDNDKLNISADGSSPHLTILEVNGTVGIGTSSPGTGNKLEVSGGSSYNILTSWGGSGGGAAISATNTSTSGDAIQANANGTGRSAIYAKGSSGTDYAVYGVADGATYAGYFTGDLHFTGTMTGGTKSFLIDHPLDPLNKTLMHYCIESPEPLLVYSGKAKTDGDGQAVVKMPEYFVALTREDQARINLTPVGRPFLTGAEWNSGNTSFTVYGDSNREVFYTVYADRDDPVMRQLKKPVVAEKGSGHFDRGKLLYPEAYGYPASMGVD
jgi:hypothetical protein